jgi:type III secretion protein V
MQSFTAQVNTFLSKRSDVVLAAAIVLIIAMMIIPLPTQMLDVLIAINIGTAALMLLVAMAVPDATKIASFPTILLITTLFRLALNVSSTRLILLYAFAGEIISAFGNFVVAGNFVVGAVVFLILLLIQFIVIAKGSERVAEVAARFTLDAMPGKQMSIDADLRNGILTPDQAKTKRNELERESQLYGAMDGAMKFVKGDAIAGIVITLINIIAGLIIGVLQQGMELGEAVQVYSLLTIGDGLVSQIPALLLSTSAGLVVTRVASREAEETHVAKDIVDQVLNQPKAILYVGILMFGAAFLPGFPSKVFVVLGLLLLVLSAPRLLSGRKLGEELAEEGMPEGGEPIPPPEEGPPPEGTVLPPHRIPVILELHPSITNLLRPGEDPSSKRRFADEMRGLREALYEDMGVRYPGIRIRGSCSHLPTDSYSILIYESPVANCTFPPDQALVLADQKETQTLGFEVTPAKLPWSHQLACLIPTNDMERAISAGLQVLSARDVIMQHLAVVLRRNSAEFLGIQEARSLLDSMEETFPALIHEVIPKNLNMQHVTAVLQNLLKEEVPIRDLRQIMESLARWGPFEKDAAQLCELVRRDLRRMLSTRYASGRTTLRVYMVDPTVEQIIRESTIQTESGQTLSMPPETTVDILSAIGRTIQPPRNLAQTPVILCDPSVRRFVRELVALEYPEVVVMSYKELTPELRIKSEDRITLEGVGV